MPGQPVVKSRSSTPAVELHEYFFNPTQTGDTMNKASIYRDYWATTGDKTRAPRAGFQTAWVQRQLIKLATREEALRAQHIKATDIF